MSLFLLNDVVLNLSGITLSPAADQARFHAMAGQFVSTLGQELFAQDPMAQHRQPEKARRLGVLIQAKNPNVSAALFVAPNIGCSTEAVGYRYAELTFDLLADLQMRQQTNALTSDIVDRLVWGRMAA